MKKKQGIGNAIEQYLYTLVACGENLEDVVDELMNAEPYYFLNNEGSTQDIQDNKMDLEKLISSDSKQIKYIAEGYINDVWNEYQILCPTCNTDRIAQDGSKNGDIKFKCKNESCETKYFYLTPFVNNKIEEVTKFVAVWLTLNYYPQNFIAKICGVHPTTVYNWLFQYDKFRDFGEPSRNAMLYHTDGFEFIERFLVLSEKVYNYLDIEPISPILPDGIINFLLEHSNEMI